MPELIESQTLSQEVRDVISCRPHFIIRNGSTFLIMIVASMLILSGFVKYPDTIKGPVKLTAVNAPKLVIAKTQGKLQKLLVANEQVVIVGQPLAFIQSNGNHQEILDLREKINAVLRLVVRDSLQILLKGPFPVLTDLGELQQAYQDFQNTFKESTQVLSDGYYQRKKRVLLQDLSQLSEIEGNSKQQQALLKQDYELQEKEYKANEQLARDKVIAQLELDQNKSKVIGKNQILTESVAQMINSNMATLNKKKEILDLNKYITDQHQKFQSALLTFKSQMEEWLQTYIVSAPENGKVLFTSFLQENELVTNGQELFYIQPAQSEYYGCMTASQNGLGKLRIGQSVLVRVESYPSPEFGYLTGQINYISRIPTARDSFLISLNLPKNLMTNYRKFMFFRSGMNAQGEVITDNRSLLVRILGKARDIISRR